MKSVKKQNNRPKSRLFNQVMPTVLSNSHELTEFTAVANMPENDELRLFIEDLYQTATLESEAMAVILEGVLTERRAIFLYSGPLIKRYLEKKGLERKPNGTVAKKLTKVLCSKSAFLECLIPHLTRKDGSTNLAGYYTIVQPDVLSLIPWWPTREAILAEVGRIKAGQNTELTIGMTTPLTIGQTIGLTTDIESDTEGDRDIVIENKLTNKKEVRSGNSISARLVAVPSGYSQNDLAIKRIDATSQEYIAAMDDYKRGIMNFRWDDERRFMKEFKHHFPEAGNYKNRTGSQKKIGSALTYFRVTKELPPEFENCFGVKKIDLLKLDNLQLAALFRKYFKAVGEIAA